MSLYDNLSSMGSGLSGGSRNLIGSLSNQKSLGEVEAEKRFEMNYEVLYRELPDLALADPDTIIALAKNSQNVDEAVTSGLQAMTAVQMQNMLKRVQELPEDQQRGMAELMPMAKRDALVTNGWKVPEKHDDNWWDKLKGGAATAFRPVAWTAGKGMQLPVIKQGLKAMDYVAEEAGRFNRVAPQAQSGKDLLEQTGMSQQQLFAQTGIKTPGSDIKGDPMGWSPFVALGQLAGGQMPTIVKDLGTNTPGDLWKAVQVWDQVGHEGDDDYLPQLQYEVWQDLEEGVGQGKGKDALRFAKAMAAGATLDDLAESEGFQGDQAEEFKQQVGLLSTTDAFRNAMTKLEGGRMSFGRNVARLVADDPIADTRHGQARWISGSMDAVYSVTIDPTIVAGKVATGARAARWGIKSGDSLHKLDRWQKGVQILEKLDNGLMEADEAKDAIKALSGGNRLMAGTIYEMEKVRRPALAVQEALKTGNWGKLVEQHPQFMRSIEDIKDYNALLKTSGLKGMDEDVAQVFEFYKEASQNRNVLRGPMDKSFGYSTKMFGHDGQGHLWIPRMSNMEQKALLAKDSIKNFVFGKYEAIPKQALDDLKAAADEAHIEIAKATGKDVDEAIEQTKNMEIDEFTGDYVVKRPNRLQRDLRQLYTMFTTPTTKEMAIHLEGGLSPEEFDEYNRMLGWIEQAPEARVKERFNRFVNGTESERHLLVQDMTNKAITTAGLTRSKEGQELLIKYGMHENHIYGHIDALKSTQMAAQADADSAARLLTRNAIHTGQHSKMMQVPSMRELVIAARKTAGLRMVGGTIRKSHLEAAMSNVWKPGTIMRFGFPLRSGMDEAILHMMRVGSWDYLKTQTLEKWSGLRRMEMDAAGQLVRNPEGAIKPVRTFMRTMSSVTGATDKRIIERATKEIVNSRKYAAAVDDVARRALVKEAVDKALENHGAEVLGRLPRAMRRITDGYDLFSLRSSKAFHKITMDKAVFKRSEWADFVLRHTQAEAKRKMLYAQASWHPMFQQEQAEVIGHTFHGLTPNRSTNELGDLTKVYSSATESGWQALPLKKDINNGWEWAGNDDLSGKYLNLSITMEKMAKTPETRAAIYNLRHHVPRSVLDEASGIAVADGLDALHELRDAVAANPDVRKLFARAAASEADADSVRRTIAALGDDLPPEDLAQVEHILNAWDDMSLETREFITDHTLHSGMLTDDFELVQNQAANGVYNALRRLDHQTDLRSLIRGQIVDNKLVAKPLKSGHLRVYAPMVDRRSAEELVRLFSDEGMMQSFAEALNRQLSSRGLMSEMSAIWSAAPVNSEQGHTLASWMAGLKAAAVQGDGAYAAAMMAGSSNYALAEAMRDALTDVLGETVLRPTVGFYDFPEQALKVRQSGIKQTSDTVVSVQPSHALKFEAIDPNQQVRQLHVQLANGEKIWVGENELNSIGRVARMEDVNVSNTFGSDRMTFFDPKSKAVRFNNELVNQDYREGMKFLRGEGGAFSTVRAKWGWSDSEYADAAARMQTQLDTLGLAENVGAGLDDMIGWYRMRRTMGDAPIPLEGAMKDNGLWDDFVELAESANRTGDRVLREWVDPDTVTQSAIAKAALDELGINIDELGLTRRQYKSLLIERERAHRALDPAGFGRPRSMSKEAIEREKDALAVAFQRARIDVPESIRERMMVAIGKETNDYRVLGEIWGNGVTEDAAVRRASQHILDEVNHLFIGQESGDVLHSITGPLLRGEHEMENLWRRAPLAELPEKAHGPTRVVAANNSWRDFLNRTFDEGLHPIIGSISRAPMFMHNFETGMDTFEHVRNNLIHRGLNDEVTSIAKRVGLPMKDLENVHDVVLPHLWGRPDFLDADLTDPMARYARAVYSRNEGEAIEALQAMTGKLVNPIEMKSLMDWHHNLGHARQAQVEVALKRATELTTPYIDDHRLRSVFQEVLGPVVLPFFYAEEQFLRRFARSLYETPHLLRKGQLAMNGLRNVGVIRKDRYGNEYVVLPGSEILMGAVADVATMVTGNEAYQVLDQPLSMRTDFVLPGWNTQQSRWGWGPVIGLATDKLTQRYPEYEWRTEPPNRKWWEYVVPGPAAGAYKAFVQDIDGAQLASAQMEAMAYLEAHGQTPDEDATPVEKEEYLEKVRSLTRSVGVLRYMTGQVGFTGMTPKDWKGDELRDEFQQLLASGLSIEEAFDRFVEMNGEENMGYTIFASNNEVGAPLPATEETLRFMLDNEEAIRNNPEAMAWFLPQPDSDSPFDRRAYNEQLALGLRTRKAPVEMLEQIYNKQASEQYFEMKDDYDAQRKALQEQRDQAKGPRREQLQRQLNDMDDAWKAQKDSYLAMHPVFAESFSPEASQRRQEVLKELEWMTAAGLGGTQGGKIGELVDLYWTFQREYSALEGSSKAANAAKAQLLTDKFNEMWMFVQKNPQAMPFFTSVIRPELPDQADTLYDKATGKVA